MKTCANKDCKEINPQPLENFHKSSSRVSGVKSRCKSCKNTEYLINKKSIRENQLIKKFGLSFKQYQNKLNKQNYKCEICGIDQEFSGKKGLVVDHNHSNNQLRGLLCGPCNSALGLLKNKINNLRNAIDYIGYYDNLSLQNKNFIWENKILNNLRKKLNGEINE